MTHLLNGTPQMASYRLPVLKLKPKTPVDVVLRCDALAALATHWIGDRTLVCAADGDVCPGCECTQARFTTFALGMTCSSGGGRLVLIEAAGASASDWLRGLPAPFFGTKIRLLRPAARHGIRFERLGRQKEMFGEPIDPFRLYQSLSVLFDLPLPRPGMTPSEWMQASLERRATLLAAAAR